MSDFRYHAVSPQRPDGIAPRLENVMLASGWRRSPKSLYDWMWFTGPADVELYVAVGGDMERSQCVLGGLMQPDCERLGHRALVELLVRASESLQVLVGRTFGDSLIGALKTIELTGDIECLDWFQFLGPAVVARWGREAQTSAASPRPPLPVGLPARRA